MCWTYKKVIYIVKIGEAGGTNVRVRTPDAVLEVSQTCAVARPELGEGHTYRAREVGFVFIDLRRAGGQNAVRRRAVDGLANNVSVNG